MMKKLMLFLLLAHLLSAQPIPLKVAEIQYPALPCAVRTENSGIYAISTFMVSGTTVNLVTTDTEELYAVGSDGLLKKQSPRPADKRALFSADVYAGGAFRLSDNRDGDYSDALGNHVSLRTVGRSMLVIASDVPGSTPEIRLPFAGDLAYAELIGIDAAGHMFLLTERYRTELPLRIQREVLTIDARGARLSVLVIPDIKYLSTDRDFRIDAEGNLYHMMTTADRLIVFRWPGLAVVHPEPIVYPAEYSYSLHYNDRVTTSEAPGDPVRQPTALVRRALALRIGESYAMHQYACKAPNLSPSNVTGPDGDVVRTPPWLLPGTNARVPYKWGGFSTLAQFDAGLGTGKFAGDINTSGVSSYSVGVDCSGFVSRCWQLSSLYSTSMMPSITTEYASWDSLKPGDAIHKVGHVRLFIERSANGGFRVVESAGRNWDVSYWTFAPSDLQGVYTPRFYNSMEQNYSFQRPTLTSVLGTGGGAAMTWDCDTTGIIGYRIYASSDGKQWDLRVNEATVGRVSQIVLPMPTDEEYYRLASVKNDAARTESDWSNAMGASRTRGNAHYLIVDGFERLTASWQSTAHTFAVRYGEAVKSAGGTFSTVKNSLAAADSTLLMQYDGVVWFLGDEATATETFSVREQTLLKLYLEKGNNVFVTGSEVGWDLSANGTAADKEFYSEYLKAVYKADNASSSAVKNEAGGFYDGMAFAIGQVYVEDYPDEIGAGPGATVCMRYDNNKIAGVQYAGTFGASRVPAKIIYLSFALETTANDTAINSVMKKALAFFKGSGTGVSAVTENIPAHFHLDQNYPNPFNPSTRVSFTLPAEGMVTLTIHDVLGREVATPVNERLGAGRHERTIDGTGLASGIYLYRLQAGHFVETRKFILLR